MTMTLFCYIVPTARARIVLQLLDQMPKGGVLTPCAAVGKELAQQ